MKFAFQRRTVIVTEVWFEAKTEQEAWAHALDGQVMPVGVGDDTVSNPPTFRRVPQLDEPEFDL
jgi:cobalamin biosynthesis Mg chelatase CobN